MRAHQVQAAKQQSGLFLLLFASFILPFLPATGLRSSLSLPLPSYRLSAGAVGNTVFFAGGIQSSGLVINSFIFAFNDVTGWNFTNLTGLDVPKFDMFVSVAKNTIFFLGGSRFTSPAAGTDSMTWAAVPATPGPTLTFNFAAQVLHASATTSFASNGVPSGSIALLGFGYGNPASSLLSEVQLINGSGSVISAVVASTALQGVGTTTALLQSGKICTVFAGGLALSASNSIGVYCDTTPLPIVLATAAPTLSVPRHSAVLAAADAQVFIIGGQANATSASLARVDVFDVSTNSTAQPSFDLAVPRLYHCAATLGYIIYVGGGATTTLSGAGTSVVEMIDGRGSMPNVTAVAPVGLSGPVFFLACAATSKAVYFAGGFDTTLGVPVASIDAFYCGNGVLDSNEQCDNEVDLNCRFCTCPPGFNTCGINCCAPVTSPPPPTPTPSPTSTPSASSCFGVAGSSPCLVLGNLAIVGTIVTLTAPVTTITGSLTTSGATLGLQAAALVVGGTLVLDGASNVVLLAPDSATLNVSGCAYFAGNLTINVSSLTSNSVLHVAAFNCSSGEFGSLKVIGGVTGTCALQAIPTYGQNELIVAFSLDPACSCPPSPGGFIPGSAGLSLVASVVVVVALAFVLLAAIAFTIVLLRVPRCREAIFPFRRRDHHQRNSSTRQLAAATQIRTE